MIYRIEHVSGIFYKSSAKELENQIRNCFLNKDFGPQNEPLVKMTDEFMAFVVPHAGFDASGAAAAHAYRKIGENENPETIVILGPNHNGMGAGAALFPAGVWMTPLGEVGVDNSFNKILEEESDSFVADELSHSMEHSIEVQLPFLKYVYGDEMPKIVPICINTYTDDKEGLEELGDSLFKAWMESGKRVLFIASSDFSHVGRNYGFIPSKSRGRELNSEVKALDAKAVDFISKLDIKGLFDYVEKEHLTICGINAIVVLMHVLSRMKGKKIKGRLLKQYTSAEISGDYDNFVDYASIQFREEK